jgi:hypothetical protein
VKKGEKVNMAGGVEGRLATQNDVNRTHCVLTWDVLMQSLMMLMSPMALCSCIFAFSHH